MGGLEPERKSSIPEPMVPLQMSRALQSLQSTLVPDGACEQVVQTVLPSEEELLKAPITLDRLKPLRVLGRSSHRTRVLLVRLIVCMRCSAPSLSPAILG